MGALEKYTATALQTFVPLKGKGMLEKAAATVCLGLQAKKQSACHHVLQFPSDDVRVIECVFIYTNVTHRPDANGWSPKDEFTVLLAYYNEVHTLTGHTFIQENHKLDDYKTWVAYKMLKKLESCQDGSSP